MKEKGIEMHRGYTRYFEEIENKGWEKFIEHYKLLFYQWLKNFMPMLKKKKEIMSL